MRQLPRQVLAAIVIPLLGHAADAQRAADANASIRASADSLFLAGRFALAAEAYGALTRADASNDVAWYRLGLSFERLTKRHEALAAFAHATTSPIQQMSAEMGLARVWSQLGNADSGMFHLRRAAEYGADPAALDRQPAFATLRSREDFKAVRQIAEDKRYPCRTIHTFDFWAGDFDAYPGLDTSVPPGGQLHNTRKYDGCVFIEDWMPGAGGGPAGMSFTYFDATERTWRFVWNDDGNGSIQFVGGLKNGAMEFQGSTRNPDGSLLLARNVLREVDANTIRHTFYSSTDNGATWQVQTDQLFVRRKPQ